jgi:hypothetical protein
MRRRAYVWDLCSTVRRPRVARHRAIKRPRCEWSISFIQVAIRKKNLASCVRTSRTSCGRNELKKKVNERAVLREFRLNAAGYRERAALAAAGLALSGAEEPKSCRSDWQVETNPELQGCLKLLSFGKLDAKPFLRRKNAAATSRSTSIGTDDAVLLVVAGATGEKNFLIDCNFFLSSSINRQNSARSSFIVFPSPNLRMPSEINR